MRRTLAFLAIAILFTGCFEIEQSIDLDRNLSGKAKLRIGVNLEPVVEIMLQIQREMEGKTGEPTAEEREKARAEFKKSSTQSKPEEEPDRAEVQKSLPPGVKLLDFKVDEKDFGVVTEALFSFEHIKSLVDVKLPSKGDDDPSKKNVIDSPFESLDVVETDKTITIRTTPPNPAKEVKEEQAESPMEADPKMEKMVRNALKDLRVAFRITAPFQIVEHNATRKEGNTLVWVFDLETFEKMEKAKAKSSDLAVRVVYRK